MVKIYTAGKMSGIPFEEQMSWRHEIQRKIEDRTDEYIKFIHPPLFYAYDSPSHKSEKEVMDWDLEHLKACDIVTVNLNGITDSTGTLYELATANAMNSTGHKHIYVVGFVSPDTKLHPWIELSLHRKEATIDGAVDYICSYLLD